MTIETQYAKCPHCERETLCGRSGRTYAERNPDSETLNIQPFILIDESYLLCTRCGREFGNKKSRV